MNTIYLHCFTLGTIEIKGKNCLDREGNDHSGAYAAYEVSSAENLYKVVVGYDRVKRKNGKIEKGANYSLRKAKNDIR